MRFVAAVIAAGWLALTAGTARAEAVVQLRIAGIAPEGTSWARDIRAFAHDVESLSGGRVALKVYLGGIAGDDLEMGRRIGRDQLDGALSAGNLCAEVAPSVRVFRIPGLVQDRGETRHVLTRLLPTMQEEARSHGMVLLTVVTIGRDMVLSREPITTMETLRRLRLWQWDLERTTIAYSRAMGLHIVPLPIADAGRAYEEGHTDGFIAAPTAAFGFQWFTKGLYLEELPFSPVIGCLVMSTSAFDRLAPELREAVKAAGVQVGMRFEETSRMQDEQLLGGLFARQGIKIVPVSRLLRAEFLEAAHEARERLGGTVIPTALLYRVQSFLADYRNEHR